MCLISTNILLLNLILGDLLTFSFIAALLTLTSHAARPVIPSLAPLYLPFPFAWNRLPSDIFIFPPHLLQVLAKNVTFPDLSI